ncbi:hypothetical protein PENCOP_c004G01403 [Penicillium coprophilum]|uniref:F-box domain-containing protein n=1 Tax=Penicillium coprophilum TaxID=36646 RepID=A0A1V6UVG3_9EURO|nr:hypothetical protein PENCOP_c004G01403 [Penicillium coprophilum]
MASTPLANLPRDCWFQILEFLPKEDLNSLSQVSHDTRASAEPFLYRSIHWDWQRPQVHRILCLLRAIYDRPELACYIWNISFVWWNVESHRNISIPKGKLDWTKTMLEFRPTLRWARKIVRDAKFPANLDTKLIQRINDGDAYVYATLLISQLHNLRSLRLDFSFILEGGFPGEVLHHSLFGNAPPGVLTQFSKLEMADYGSNLPLTEFRECVNPRKAYQFIPWFYLPSLKILEIWLHSVEGICVFSGRIPRISLGFSNLRSLVIAKAAVLPEDIATLLSRLPYLESLHVGMAYKCRATIEFLKRPECLLHSLETSSQTIKHLSISVELLPCCLTNFRLRVSGENGKPFRGMLKKFPQLKTASLPLNFLIGWGTTAYELRDVLPLTLEALHITSDLWQNSELMAFEMAALGALESFMRHKEHGSHPSLRTFSYEGLHEYNEDELSALGLQVHVHYPYLVKREAMLLFCLRRGYNLFSRYSDCTTGFMLKHAMWEDNVAYWFPWPFAGLDELPASMPREIRMRGLTDVNFSNRNSSDGN